MDIQAFQITKTKNIETTFQAGTLDELTRSLPQGFYTTFTTISAGKKVMGLRAHLRRLYAPAQESGLTPAVDELTLRARIAQLVEANLPRESRVRLILTKDAGKIYVGIQPSATLPAEVYQQGVHVITTLAARHDPRIKDTGFITESAEQRKQLSKNIFEVLLTQDGKILEGMTSNFYVIARSVATKQSPDVKLITAQRGILLGVTRRAVLRIARGQGMGIEYRAPRLDEKFDEAFLTSSSRGVVPIVSIDHHPVGQGSVGKRTKILMQAYWEYVERKAEEICKLVNL
jgi:branched-chain amino acid aminotransferase